MRSLTSPASSIASSIALDDEGVGGSPSSRSAGNLGQPIGPGLAQVVDVRPLSVDRLAEVGEGVFGRDYGVEQRAQRGILYPSG